MNNQREPSNESDISRINNNINNIYYTLNIISNSLLMSQSQNMMNELRRNDRTRLMRESLFRPTQPPNNTTSTPSHFSMPPMYPEAPTPTPGVGTRPTPARDSLSNIFRNIFRNEIPTSIGNMEISVLGLNTNDSTSADSEHIVVSHHNIFNNTKIKTKVYENDSDANETNVDTLERCTICLCDIENNSIIREINKCKHIFHVECADRWFQDNIKCPHCRQDIRVEIVN